MSSFSFTISMVALATVFGPSFTFSVPLSPGDASINQLLLIGTIEGKSYFAEGTSNRTWQEANTFCNSSGMHLATVTSAAQQTLLKNAYDPSKFSDCHWTGGRDSLKPSQYSWDSNGEVLNPAVIEPFISENGLQSCVCFRPYNEHFFRVLCTKRFKTLCELNHGTFSD